jgi:hypothetical protein
MVPSPAVIDLEEVRVVGDEERADGQSVREALRQHHSVRPLRSLLLA